jgi:uncharacterized FlgJ-related protein
MVYKFDKISLRYKKVKNIWVFLPYMAVIILLITCAISLFILNKTAQESQKEVFAHKEYIKLVSEEAARLKEENDILKNNEFSSEMLWNFLLDSNIPFPHIVMAQAEIETGGFTSEGFKKRNNLFGMRPVYSRTNFINGKHGGYATCETWKMSVADYALYQKNIIEKFKVKTEDEYLLALKKKKYAEAPDYTETVKKVSEKYKEKTRSQKI